MDAYFDCFSGISGDMILGAFLDLGVPPSYLKKNLSSLFIGNFDIVLKKKKQESISATDYSIVFYQKPEARTFHDIANTINNSTLSPNVKQQSIRIFQCIANAEGKTHKCDKEHVCFHEIGALDSIADIVGTTICMEYLGIENIFSSELPLGNGFTKCDHGTLPLPAPATLEILKNIPVYGGNALGELVTPTGAGFIASMSQGFGKIPNMIVKRVGYGCGKTIRSECPNMLRIILGDFVSPISFNKTELVSVIETNIDDMNPEICSFIIEKLFNIGALDVCFMPIIMKKSRPGIKIEVICPEYLKTRIIEELFSQTTTLGIRHFSVERDVLKRGSTEIQTKELGKIKVKLYIQADGRTKYIPEYDVCKEMAIKHDLPIKKVYDIVNSAIYKLKSTKFSTGFIDD